MTQKKNGIKIVSKEKVLNGNKELLIKFKEDRNTLTKNIISLKLEIAAEEWPYLYEQKVMNIKTGEERLFDRIEIDGRESVNIYLFRIKRNGERFKFSNEEWATKSENWRAK